jgi:DNA-binding NtrC family response regulator
MKVLVVDDEISLVENIAEILVSAGHEVAVAGTAEEALARLRLIADATDVLLTDYRLPGATEADLIRSLRRIGNSIPALVITAYGDDGIAESALSAGVADVFGKPVDFKRLLTWVATVGQRVGNDAPEPLSRNPCQGTTTMRGRP